MNLKIVRKDCKELMKFWAIFAFFWLPFLLKNHYFKWITEESSRGKFYYFEELGLKLPFSRLFWGWVFINHCISSNILQQTIVLENSSRRKVRSGLEFFSSDFRHRARKFAWRIPLENDKNRNVDKYIWMVQGGAPRFLRRHTKNLLKIYFQLIILCTIFSVGRLPTFLLLQSHFFLYFRNFRWISGGLPLRYTDDSKDIFVELESFFLRCLRLKEDGRILPIRKPSYISPEEAWKNFAT